MSVFGLRLESGRLPAAAFAFAAALGLLQPASRAADAPRPITIGYQADPAWLQFAARQLHLFEKVGLAPKYVKFLAGAPMIAAAQSGGIDVASPGIVPFLTGVGQGVNWVAVGDDACGGTVEGFVARKGSGIKTIADLKGKKIGYFRASTSHYALVTALERNHIGPDQVQMLHMAPAQQLAAMINKDIDAAEVWEPWMQKMVHQANGQIIATEKDLGIYTACAVFAVRRDWLAGHRETLRRFLVALVLAQQALDKDKTPAVKFISQEMGIPDAWAVKIYEGDPPAITRWLDPNYEFSIGENGVLRGNLPKVAKFLYEQHVIPRPIDATNVIDASVIAQVLKAKPE